MFRWPDYQILRCSVRKRLCCFLTISSTAFHRIQHETKIKKATITVFDLEPRSLIS